MFNKKKHGTEDEFSALARLLTKAEDGDEDEDEDEEGDDDKDAQANLFEGEDGDDKDDDDEDDKKYDASYMKKYLKRYMKENTAYCKGAMSKLGAVAKAAEDESDFDGIGDADATLIDGTAFIKAQVEVNRAMVDAVQGLVKAMDGLSNITAENNALAKATGAVLLSDRGESGKAEITPRKSVVAGAPMSKATTINVGAIKDRLLKAAMTGEHDEAGNVLSQFEMANGNLNMLPAASVRYIESLRD